MKGIEKIRMMLALMLALMKRRLPETRRLSSGITTLALAGIVLLVAAGSVSAYCPAPGNTVITASCTLNRSWDVPAGEAGYIIEADGVTIDGAGHKITGAVTVANCQYASETEPCAKSGIYINGPAHNARNVVIKNLEITGFCTGIALKGGGPPLQRIDNVIIDNCEIHHNGFNNGDSVTQGIHVCWLAEGAENNPALTIVNNDIHHNEGTGGGCGAGGNGIFIYGGSPNTQHEYCDISYNELHHNAKAGFWTKMMLSKCTITHNNATENGGGAGITDDVQGGIILRCKLSDENFVAYNNASNNGGATNYGYGIYVGGSSNTISDNTANDNTASGICMGRSDGSDYNVVSSNTACGNKGCCCDGRADIGTCGGGPAPDGCSGNNGVDNTCDICFNCGGYNTILCPYHCPDTPDVDLRVSINDGAWDPPGQTGTYTVSYTIANDGRLESVPTHARIWIDGIVVATLLPVPAIPGHGTYDGTNGSHPVDNTVAVNGATYIDTVMVCADILNEETREDNETNNCMSNNFGGPDLRINLPASWVGWIDPSLKTYNLIYTVENVGDTETTHPVWVNFTELNDEWKDCVDPDPIPAGLQPGVTTGLLTAGPFRMGGDSDLYSDWLEEWVNFDHTCPENNWDDLHGNRVRFTEGYPGGCKECGDVNCDTLVNAGDIGRSKQKVYHPPQTLSCEWAADVNGNCLLNAGDIGRLKLKVYHPPQTLDCCKGCPCQW